MNRSVIAVRFVQTLILAFGLIALVGGGAPASANQSGPTVNESSEFQIALCRGLGGVEDVTSNRTSDGLIGVYVRCTGGMADGMNCYNGRYTGTYCFWEGPGKPTNSQETSPEIQTVDSVVVAVVGEDVEVVEDVQPVEETVDPVVTDDPVVEDEPVDPLPPVVEDSPLDETVPDVEVVEADQVVTDEPIQDLPGLESDVPVVPVQEILEDVPVLEAAP